MSFSQCAVWDFRANEDYYTVDDLKKWLSANCKKWVFQKEQGDSGYIHWQGRFSLIKKRKKEHLLKLYTNIKAPNYLAPTTNNDYKNVAFYAMKVDTRIEGPWKDDDNKAVDEVYLPRQFRDLKLLPFQQQIVDSAKVFEPRKINLIFDEEGCNGKSTVAAICEILYGGIDMPPINDYKELVQLACDICMDTNNRSPNIICIDMPRAVNKEKLYGLYSAIEQIKKGKLYDTRHHYKAFWIDSPQVWVFSNCLPERSMLSADRWVIWSIKDTHLVPYNDNIEL